MEQRLKNVRQVFLDMDGTIYHGSRLYPTTIPFLNFLKSRGIGYKFLSNNSSFSTDEYVAKLGRLGITATPDEFYISTDYCIDYIKANHPAVKKLFIMGMESIFPAFEAAGFTVTDSDPDAVIVAFDRTLTYEKLCRTAYFIKQGIPAFATHPDVFCPTDQPTFLVDCGAFIACLETATRCKITVLGKPDPGFLRAAAARCGVAPENTLMAGDRLSTDIRLGINAGSVTCRLTGPGADLTACEGVIPDFTVDNLGELQAIWENL